jgi:putative redox protein
MKQSVSMKLAGNMAFETVLGKHRIIVDASEEGGGQDLGTRPKILMLVALGGCTGMDVVSILRKMKVEFNSFEVVVDGDMADEHPKRYLSMKINYNFTGKDLPLDKIQKAVDLSVEKYCGVYASYKDSIKIDHVINLLTE